MSINYHTIKAAVDKAFTMANAMDAVLQQHTGGGSTWDDETITSVSQNVKIIRDFERVRDITGTLVGYTQLTVYMKVPEGNPPVKDDFVMISGKIYPIEEVRPVAPSDVVLMYECDLKV